jgi:ankyrin repeat protein
VALDNALVSEWLAAAERGNLTTLKRLLAAEPRLLDAQGTGPYWEGNFRAIHYAVARGHRKVVRWLLDHGASARPIRGDGDWAPIHFAAFTTARRDLIRLLIARGAKKDIFTAAAIGDTTAVRRLLGRNRQLARSRGPDGATPLHFAASVDVANALLAAGANPNARDRFHGQSAPDWTLRKPAVLKVLLARGADPNAFNRQGHAAIHIACASGCVAAIRALLGAGARLDLRDKEHHSTPLEWAEYHKRRRAVALLKTFRAGGAG